MGDPYAPLTPAAPTAQPGAQVNLIPPPKLPPAASGGNENPLDTLGRTLFGQGNGSLLGGIPGVGEAGRLLGPVAGGLAGLAIKPIEATATVVSHIPTGWVPGGADEQFRNLGDWMKTNDPTGYVQWQVADANAGGDILGGGNIKSDFTREWGQKYADMTKEGVTGPLAYTPGLAFSPAGSLGGALVDALSLWDLAPKLFGLPSGGDVQKALQGTFGLSQVVNRANAGQDLNPIEQEVINHLTDGSWSQDHAENYLISHGQGLSRDLLPNLVGTLLTDPMSYAMLGEGEAANLAKQGASVLTREAGLAAAGAPAEARTALESLAVATKYVQTAGPTIEAGGVMIRPLQGIYKVTKTLIDPFSVLPKKTATQGMVDLAAGGATKAIDGIYGPASVSSAFKTASKYGFTTELQNALGVYSANLARQFVVTAYRATELLRTKGESLIGEVTPDSVVGQLMKSAAADAVTRLTDYGYKLRKLFVGNVEDDAQLAGRLTSSFGRSAEEWAADVAKMGDEEKSLWHAATYSASETAFEKALAKVTGYVGNLKLNRVVLLNDNKLDNVAAQVIEKRLLDAEELVRNEAAAQVKAAVGRDAKAAIKQSIDGKIMAAKRTIWNAAADKYSEVGDIGKAQASLVQIKDLEEQLRKLIESGRLHTRITPDELTDPALAPLREFLDKNTINGKQLWNFGFAPDEMHIWGFNRDSATDLLRVTSEPFVTHTFDVAPFGRPVNDMARNYLGQLIGPVAAGKLAKPIEAMEVSIKTARDIVSGQRLLMNMEQRFTSNMAKLGVAGRESRRLFRAARDVSQLERTTIQGVTPQNVWKAVADIIPEELKGVVTQRVIMNELLDASGGDLRIMGLTSGFTQRIRTALSRLGLPNNYAGQATSTFYRTVRYSLNPTFFIQRITDGIYFNILKGVTPIWTGRALKEGSVLWQAEQVLAKMGETGLARDMGMDMPEYQLRSLFQEGLRSRLGDTAAVGKLEGIANAGNRWQVNNMVANFNARLGDIVTESLNEARATFEKLAADTTLSEAERAGYRSALDGMTEWGDIQAQYAIAAGRGLSDTEVGLKYIQEMFNDSLGQKLDKDGLLEFRENIKTGVYHKPANVGEVQNLGLPYLATDLGFVTEHGQPDLAALREAIGPNGSNSVEWLQERLANDFSAHPDYVKRVVSALRFDSGRFWGNARVALDLSPHETEALRGIIAREALSRGMEPNEFLSEVLHTNLGKISPNDHLGKLLEVIKGGFVGSERQQIGKLTNIFMGTMDLSAQRTVLDNYVKNLPGLAQQAYDSGDLVRWQTLNRVRDLLENGLKEDGTIRTPETIADYLRLYPDEGGALHIIDEPNVPPGSYELSSSVGPGVYKLSPDEQKMLVQTFHEIRSLFPDMHMVGFDVVDMGQEGFAVGPSVKGITITNPDHEAGQVARDIVVVLNQDGFGPGAAAEEAARANKYEVNKLLSRFGEGEGKATLPRQSFRGMAAYNVGYTVRDDIWHEFGHVIYDNIMQGMSGSPLTSEFLDFTHFYGKSEGRRFVSEYSFKNAGEAWAELFDLAFNPDHQRELEELRGALAADTLPIGTSDAAEQLLKDVSEARQMLIDNGIFNPNLAEPGLASKEVAAATGEGFADLVARRAAGEAIANPDVEAVVQGFVKWTKETVASGLSEGSRAWVGKLANELAAKIPIDNAYLFNRSESLVEQLLRQKIVLAQRDAFRLAEMSPERTMAGRSLNHPVFGLYPSSYMWGKVFPEIVKFLAQTPFGFETGGLAYQLARTEQAIAIQREYDPNSVTAFDKLATGPTAFLLDYLTPSLPTSDMSSATAPWAQAIAKSGLDIGKMTEAEWKTIDPRRWASFFGRSGSEIAQGVQKVVPGAVNGLQQLVGQGVQQQPTAAPTTGPAGQLTQPLNNAMDELTSLFNQ